MSVCGKLSQGIAIDCDALSTPGLRDKLFLINFDEKGTLTRLPNNPLAASAITLAASALAYEFEGLNNSVDGNVDAVKPGFRTLFSHNVTFRVFEVSATSKKVISDITKGKYVAILVTNSETIEILGWKSGLTIAEGTIQNYKDLETGGGFVINLVSDEESPEDDLPISFVGSTSPYNFNAALATIQGLT
jgi:hypothetical protein